MRTRLGFLATVGLGIVAAGACTTNGTGQGETGGSSFGGGAGTGGSAAGSSGGASGGSAGASGGSAGASGGSAGASGGSAGASGGSGGSTSSGGNGGSTSSGGNAGSSLVDANLPDVTFGYDGYIAPPEACAATQVKAQLIPLAIYILLDQSGSMGLGSGKWQAAKSAITAFVNDPSSIGNKVALQYFPYNNSQDGCNGVVYATPDVPMGVLPGNAGAVVTSLGLHNPGGGTPTEGAVRGLDQYCQAYMQANPSEKCVAILITDGDPSSGCDDSTNGISAIAQSYYNGTPSVLLFTMGMVGASFNVLDAIATAGGSDCRPADPAHTSCDATGGSTAFLDALKLIQQSALGCDYNMPKPDAGFINLSDVKVLFTPSGGVQQPVNNIGSPGACGSGGWFFDNNANPTKITLCPESCNVVKADNAAQINIELGCLGS